MSIIDVAIREANIRNIELERFYYSIWDVMPRLGEAILGKIHNLKNEIREIKGELTC